MQTPDEGELMKSLAYCMCVGLVSGTLLWLAVANFRGFSPEDVVIAYGMGAVLAGVAYALRKRPLVVELAASIGISILAAAAAIHWLDVSTRLGLIAAIAILVLWLVFVFWDVMPRLRRLFESKEGK